MRSLLERVARLSSGLSHKSTPPESKRHFGSSPASNSASSGSPGSPACTPIIHVEFCEDGHRGWEMLSSGLFHLAIIDINMPDVSGLDISWCYQQLLMQTGHSGSTPAGAPAASAPGAPSGGKDEVGEGMLTTIIIACTSSDIGSPTSLQRYGIHDVLPKPVSLPALRHMLHKWMPRDYCASVPQEPAAQHRTLGGASTGPIGGRILLVEDCEVTRLATQLLLQQQGLRIDTALTGEDAMAILTRRDYDLCLFDLDLPDISGCARHTAAAPRRAAWGLTPGPARLPRYTPRACAAPRGRGAE